MFGVSERDDLRLPNFTIVIFRANFVTSPRFCFIKDATHVWFVGYISTNCNVKPHVVLDMLNINYSDVFIYIEIYVRVDMRFQKYRRFVLAAVINF